MNTNRNDQTTTAKNYYKHEVIFGFSCGHRGTGLRRGRERGRVGGTEEVKEVEVES